MISVFLAFSILALAAGPAGASVQGSSPAPGPPRTFTYREIGGQALKAYVFSPSKRDGHRQAPAVLLFHGGGWSTGSPEWTFEAARRFASLGLVAVSIEYRLSQGGITPIEALSDTCAAFQWTRKHAVELNVDPERVAGYGVSAGGHLAAAAASPGCHGADADGPRSSPDALLLWSPALDVTTDGWFRRLLQGRAPAADLSPAEHSGSATPPTSIVHGAKDTLTPLSGVKRFCERAVNAGNVCELNVYENVGHLLTRNLKNQESDFDPDPGARNDGIVRQERFLRTRGFIPDK
jgi:acetyl esterase/lipase